MALIPKIKDRPACYKQMSTAYISTLLNSSWWQVLGYFLHIERTVLLFLQYKAVCHLGSTSTQWGCLLSLGSPGIAVIHSTLATRIHGINWTDKTNMVDGFVTGMVHYNSELSQRQIPFYFIHGNGTETITYLNIPYTQLITVFRTANYEMTVIRAPSNVGSS